jgi:gliding motility-associated-like protein
LFLDGSAGGQCRWEFSSPQLLGSLATNGPKCPGDSIILRARNRLRTGSTYTYQFGGGTLGILPADTARSYTVLSPVLGTYSVTITETDITGSTQTIVASINVTFAPVPQPTTLAPVTLRCGNSCGTIDVGNGLGTYTKFVWSNGDTTQTASVCQRGLYTVTVTNGYGCSATGTTVVDSVNLMFLHTSTAQLADCQGNNGHVQIDSVIGGVQRGLRYWVDNQAATAQTDSLFRGIRAGTHILWARDSIGCIASDTLRVNRLDTLLPRVKIKAHTIPADCDGRNGTIVLDEIQGGVGAPYTFSLNNAVISLADSLNFRGISIGNHYLTAIDTVFCTDTLLLTMPQRYYPELQYLAYNPLIYVGEKSELRPTVTRGSLVQWYWDNVTSDMSCYRCERPYVSPEITTTYTVTVTADNTCSLTRTVTVQVRSRLDVYAPNIITPNGDGNNDVFTLYAGHSLARIRLLQIFDRWGGLIFENRNFPPSSERSGWDGTFKGQILPVDVYVWHAELDFSDGQTETISGDVSIVR